MQIRNERSVDTADLLLFFAAALVIGAIAYQPYFFGDELMPFYYSYEPAATLLSIYSHLNAYKPRLVFNGIWALGAYFAAPRYVFMLITIGGITVTASLLYYLARVQYGVSRSVALAAGAVIVTSRFSMLVYYDYIAGIIEALSMACFVFAVVLVIAPLAFRSLAPTLRFALTVIACIFAVFIHERYMAGTIALGVVMIARSFTTFRSKPRVVPLCQGIAVAVIPVMAFLIANKLCGSLPIATGTAARPTTLSLGTLERAVVYLGNVFLALNHGHEWLVGSLQLRGALHIAIIAMMAIVLASMYVRVVVFHRKEVQWVHVAEIVLMICALVGAASLPDWSRQEGRWMTPVLTLAVVLGMRLGQIRTPFVTALLAINLVYLVAGSQSSVYNIEASRVADAIAAPLNTLHLGGRTGIVLNAASSGTHWILGGAGVSGNTGDSGAVFSRVNFASRIQVDPSVAVGDDYDFGLYYTGEFHAKRPVFAYLDKQAVRLIRLPGTLADGAGQVVGGLEGWRRWNWNEDLRVLQDGVELRPGAIGTRSMPSAVLDHKVIVYRARALTAGTVPMRIQVNWSGARGQYLGAFITVVDVGKTMENFAAFVDAPAGATEGMVYANLQDGATGGVELKSIRLVSE